MTSSPTRLLQNGALYHPPIHARMDSGSNSRTRRVLHACSCVATDRADSTLSHRSWSGRHERRSPHAQVVQASALQSLREAVLLLPAPGAPRRARRSRQGPPPLSFPPREQPRRRVHPPFLCIRVPHPRISQHRARTPTLCRGDHPQVDLGVDWMNDHADVALPWALECVMTPDLLLTFALILLLYIYTLLQLTRTHIRPDLRLNAAPKCRVVDCIQRARPRTLREAGPNRLGHCASIQRRATRHPLDVHKARVVAYGALLSDGSCELPAPAEATASPEDTGCSRLRIPTWVTRYSCGPENGRDPAVFLVSVFFSIGNRLTKIPAPWFRRGASLSPFLLKLFFTYSLCYLCFMFYSIPWFLASILHNIIIFSGHCTRQQDAATSRSHRHSSSTMRTLMSIGRIVTIRPG